MISKEAIKKTVVCYWSDENETFVTESAMIPHVVLGVGASREESILNFAEALDDMYDELETDNVAGYSKGRPAKGYVQFNTNIRPASKMRISKLSEDMGISQGEAVDYLVFFQECKINEGVRSLAGRELANAIQILSEQIQQSTKVSNNRIDRIEQIVLSLTSLSPAQPQSVTAFGLTGQQAFPIPVRQIKQI